MHQPNSFAVIAIPLNRPEVIAFLGSGSAAPRGATLQIIGQRPTVAAEAAWRQRLQATPQPTVADLLAIDDPHAHLVQTWTDRLVPPQFLAESGFLTRNLGGWSPIYFGVAGLPAPQPDDPLLNVTEILHSYGPQINAVTADPIQVAGRLQEEMGCTTAELTAALIQLSTSHQQWPDLSRRVVHLYAQLVAGRPATGPPLPDLLLLDELLAQLVRLEQQRREAVANGDEATAAAIGIWQEQQRAETGLQLILKGEYIMGRHRRSTVLIAPELGLVVKQPAPEPFHEVQLSARIYEGRPENWPRLTQGGALVTPRGRLRLTLAEGLVPRLYDIFGHEVRFSTLLGLTVEPFVVGQTVQAWVLADPARLTPSLYDTFVLHQQTCEHLGVENGDWHSANFIRREKDGAYIHIDWGAARPLRPEELTPSGERARLNQVHNIAFSFHDDGLATRVEQLHKELVADAERLEQVRRRALNLVSHFSLS